MAIGSIILGGKIWTLQKKQFCGSKWFKLIFDFDNQAYFGKLLQNTRNIQYFEDLSKLSDKTYCHCTTVSTKKILFDLDWIYFKL